MDTPFDPTLESDIRELMKEIPPPIRAFFASGKVETVAKNLMLKNRLHIDQGAIVEREVILLLLGLKNPTEFVQTLLEEARLDEQTVNSIVQDINAQIFVPLREEMRRGPVAEVAPPQAQSAAAEPPRRETQPPLPPLTTIIPANPQLPPRPAPMLTSVPRYVPPKKYFHLQNKIPPPSEAASASSGTSQSVAQDTTSPVSPSGSQTFLNPARLLEDHEEPHLEMSRAAETPLRQALRTVLPRPLEASGVVGPPANLPGAMPPAPTVPKPPVITSPPPSPRAVVTPPSAKPYSSDPYREPIDER